MLQAGRELDLAHEALRTQRVRQLMMQQLDRHQALVAHVMGEIHRCRSPTTNLPLQDIASGEGLVKSGRDIKHGLPVSDGTG